MKKVKNPPAISKPFNFKLPGIMLIFCLGAVLYSNTFACSFHFDDTPSIVSNFAIRNINDLQSIWNFWPSRFLTYLSFAFNYHLNGLDVFGYHLFNLAIHLVSAVLVWWLVLLTLSTPVMKENKISRHADLVALFAGLVFVSHPVQTQAVTYIVQRAASMATLFYLACVCLYVKSRLIGEAKGRPYYIGALIMAILAMFTKEITITLPLTIMLYEFSFLRIKNFFNWKYSVPFLIVVLLASLILFLSETNPSKLNSLRGEPGISSMHYLLTQFRVMLTYVRLVFLPLNQNLDYDYSISNSLFELPTFISFIFLISTLFCAKLLFSKYRLLSFSIFWFFLTLLPESSLFPIKDVIFEHRLYLPMAGYSIFLVSGVYYGIGKFYRHSERSEESKGALRSFASLRMTMIVLTIVIGINSYLTYQRNKVWIDDLTLWDDAVAKSPHKARPYNDRGFAYDQQNDFTRAMPDYNKAIELDPEYADAYNNRGRIFDKVGNLTQAILDYDKAIEIDPQHPIAHNNRANTYAKQGKFTQAGLDFNKAIEINPNYAEAYKNRGLLYSIQGHFPQAIAEYDRAIEINPSYAEAYCERGNAYSNQGHFTQAISDYNKAIEINPAYAEAYSNRGIVYAKQGNSTQAISDFTKAIEIKPDYADAYKNRAIALKQSSGQNR